MSIITGYIYILYSDIDPYFYIGSTKAKLTLRLKQHKNSSRAKSPEKWTKKDRHFNQIGWDNVKIEPLEEHQCTRTLLHNYENSCIQRYDNDYMLNTLKATPFEDDDILYCDCCEGYLWIYGKIHHERMIDHIENFINY